MVKVRAVSSEIKSPKGLGTLPNTAWKGERPKLCGAVEGEGGGDDCFEGFLGGDAVVVHQSFNQGTHQGIPSFLCQSSNAPQRV